MTEKLPFYAKAAFFFIGLFAFVAVLYIAQDIIVPLVFATIIAIVLHPVVAFFVRLKVNRIAAIIITIILAFLAIIAVCAFLYTQLSRFSESWPAFINKFTDMINQGITWASGYFHVNPQKINEWITKEKTEVVSSSGALIGKTLINVGSTLAVVVLIPVYIFMLLFYEPLFFEFIQRLFATRQHEKVKEIVSQTKNVIQSYLVGLVIEAVIVASLNSMALLILGIDYAIVLGVIGAILNVIPYLGGIIAIALPMIVALVTKPSAWYLVYILASYSLIQLIDNNFIVPKIVASKVKLNALVSIVIVIAGDALWGIPGMFLSIPLLAIVKVIFDNIEPLKPWGFLLGDIMPVPFKIKSSRFSRSRKTALK